MFSDQENKYYKVQTETKLIEAEKCVLFSLIFKVDTALRAGCLQFLNATFGE